MNLTRFTFLSIFAFVFGLVYQAPYSHSQLPNKIKADDQAYREYMVKISRHLGVTCLSCHNTNNFSSDEKITFKIAKDHIRLTQVLIDNGFDGEQGRPKADCYMCHRGKIKPDYKEKFDPMTMEKLKKDKKKEEIKNTPKEEDDEFDLESKVKFPNPENDIKFENEKNKSNKLPEK